MILRDLSHDPRAVADLRWYWLASLGDIAGPSSHQAMVARLEVGGRTGGAPVVDLSERSLNAAGRARLIKCALDCLSKRDREILHRAFGRIDKNSMPERDLPAFGRSTGVVPMTESARLAYRQSKTRRPLEEWLVRLVCKSAQNADAARSVRVIRREADNMLGAALARFSNARRRRWG